MSTKRSSFMLFLIGLFSMTQIHVVGSIGISELVIFAIAPFVFFATYRTLKADGFSAIAWLSLLACLGCFIGSMFAGTPTVIMMKGMASPYAVFGCVVVFHSLLRKNLTGLKWVLLGTALSLIINIFVFQPETNIVRGGMKAEGEAAVELVTSGVLFWSNRVSEFLTLPIKGWFLKIPIWYSLLAPFFVAAFFLLYSGGSGRSAALAMLISVVILLMGRKSRRGMYLLTRRIPMMVIGFIVVIFMFRIGYEFAAPRGLLGVDAQNKYERIANTKKGSAGLLLSGRLETFIGLRACIDKPILGFGAKALDRWGYVESMIKEYGTWEDYEIYRNSLRTGYLRTIPAHSHIVSAWLDDGIFGLLLWCYVLYVMYQYFRKNTYVMPQWYGYFALSIPGAVWDIFFSPFGGRVSMSLLITCLLIVSAIKKNRIPMPIDMELKAQEYAY